MRFSLYDSHFCFVNCHLAAGQSKLERRNQGNHKQRKKFLRLFLEIFILRALMVLPRLTILFFRIADYRDILTKIQFVSNRGHDYSIFDHEYVLRSLLLSPLFPLRSVLLLFLNSLPSSSVLALILFLLFLFAVIFFGLAT